MIRQGDILFVPITADELPAGIRRQESGIIAQGEASGHHHRVAVADLPVAELFEAWEGKFLRVTERGVSIVHEEHKTVTIPPGTYRIHQAREYDYLAQFSRPVRD
jgi:hypothetical protein